MCQGNLTLTLIHTYWALHVPSFGFETLAADDLFAQGDQEYHNDTVDHVYVKTSFFLASVDGHDDFGMHVQVIL